MAINLASLTSQSAPLAVPFEGDTVNCRYYPHRITPAYRALLQKLDRDDGEDYGSAVRMIADVVAPDWDVMAGDEPFLPNDERDWPQTLAIAPTAMIGAVARAIWEDLGKRMTGE